ncbi:MULTISPECIES: TolC family protein [unclassified Siphonobacter]|uniref:TolC family protein n=1 Tax=unclassified Siphonobacter TaxID=2635712 RepID=UPI000CB07081|nr:MULTISPECIES: TolC family protein [unclassified Siphonobacter]PKK38195.1 RND transporter [Siphonobacter sp. SORGH_AS_0500]
MVKNRIVQYVGITLFTLLYTTACKVPSLVPKTENRKTPASYNNSQDSTNTAQLKWKEFYNDPYLTALIDTALHNNQELNMVLQEIEISRNEIRVRRGEYLPFVGLKAGVGVDKVARYTNIGAMEATTEMKPGRAMPDPVPDFLGGAYARWEIDIWNKLHNAQKAAVNRYLATVEGKNFVITSLVAEIANSYFELLALDNQLAILKQNIDIQTNALEIVRLQKQATRVTELAVRRFEAQVLNTRSLQYKIQQQITETENRINFLLARYPQPIPRNDDSFNRLTPQAIQAGLPSQLLANRPDIKRAEQELAAAKLDVQVAKAQFYPSLGISAALGYRAFNPAYLIKTPESILYSLAGELVGPLVNRNAIKATYANANAKQIQAVYNYEKTILNAYFEVANQMAKIGNLEQSYSLQEREVEALTQSTAISNDLFQAARADYMEVLLTQRDALESKFELIETKKQQLNAMVNIYQALGGGWN